MTMPEKNPDVWAQIWAFLSYQLANHNQFWCGVFIAFVASVSKSFLYGKKDTVRRVLVEAFLCSLIAGSIRPILVHFGLEIDLITPIGAAVGLLGTSVIRQVVLRFLKNKAGADDE